ncbi:MAG: class I SAM-dependent methyltransferase [Patescibacteria group bacterium]|jgi:ubiquinone/menaquinone biosynthesis C-methylase UbiE
MKTYNGNELVVDNEQLKSQQQRWNERSRQWDSEIQRPDHYANFEDGYKRFVDLEEKVFGALSKQESGIDIGCGTAAATGPLAKHVQKLYLLDIAEQMLQEAQKKYPGAVLLHSGASDIPLGDESVHLAISRGIVVSHMPKELIPRFFSELSRIVKPNGVIIFDFLSNDGSASFTNLSEKISFTQAEIIQNLQNVGFEKIEFDGDPSLRVVRVVANKKS